jgi:uncharacterized protein
MKAPKSCEIICWVYASPRQDEMYLYLKQKDDFDSLPNALRHHFGSPRLVMKLALHGGRKLAREDVESVMNNLDALGYHLQMPPKIDAELNDGE